MSTNEPYHSWLGALQAEVSADRIPNRWAHLFGLIDAPNDRLLTIAGNWLHPALPELRGARFERFDAVQKAYVLRPETGAKSYTVGFPEAPEGGIVNPVFLLRGCASDSAVVTVDGVPVAAGACESAVVEYDYEPCLLVWLGRTIHRRETIKITIR